MPTVSTPLKNLSTWTSSNGTFCQEWIEKSKTWVRTVDYEAKRSAGNLPINPFDTFTHRGSNPDHWWQKTTRKSDGTVTGAPWGDSKETLRDHLYEAGTRATSKLPSLDFDKNALILKALTKAGEMKVNLPVAFAEAKKTVDMITDAAERLITAYRAFRKGDLRKVAKTLHLPAGTAHKNWLAYKYGWIPVLQDMKGAAEYFASQVVTKHVKYAVSTSVDYILDDKYVTTSPSAGGGTATDTRIARYDRYVRVKLYLVVNYPYYAEAQTLGLTNPWLTAWELIPFSFVADWIISIGDYLTALTALQGLTVEKALFSHKDLIRYEHTVRTSSGQDAVNTYSEAYYRAVASGDHFTREPITVDINTLYPPLKSNPFTKNWDRIFTSAALVRAVTAKR